MRQSRAAGSVAAVVAALLAAALSATPAAEAAEGGPEPGPTVSIEVSSEVYYYGDHLSFTIGAPGYGSSGGGGDVAYLYITHENGITSSPVPIPLTGGRTVSTSPSPFNPPPEQYPDAPYPTGLYTLRIEYGGGSDEATFTLLDSGRIVIPSWIKDTTRLWASDRIGDATYASSIGYLIRSGIIDVGADAGAGAADAEGGGARAGPVAIPAWVKQSAQWWVDGMIDDDAYGTSLQYLLRAGVIVV